MRRRCSCSSSGPIAARPGFVPDADDRAGIAEIVRRLDGLPLAIELAAARIGAMSPAALAERLEHRFELLGGRADRR